MLDVDPKDLLQVATADDQQPIQALGADRPHPALRVRVRLGACTDVKSTSAPSERNTSSKLRELRVPIVQHQASPSALFAQYQQQVAGLLGDPLAVGVGGDAGQVDPAGVQLDEEQHFQPSQPMPSTVRQVAGQIPAACRRSNAARQEVAIGPWRRIQSVAAQRGADRGRGDGHAEPLALTADLLGAPGRVLLGQADDRRRTSGSSGGPPVWRCE